MHESTNHKRDQALESALADVSHTPLDVVLNAADSALDKALKRRLRDLARPGESYAAHGSTP